MKFKAIVVSAVLVAAAFGQMGPGHGGGRGQHDFGMHAGKVVTGAPYSAEVSNTSVKMLQDGNSIQHSMTGHVARDRQGRTYSEETMTGMWGKNGSKTVTFISDPIAGYVYSLDAETKTATRRALHQRSGEHADAEAKPVNPNVATTELGTQVMNGVNVAGKKVTHTVPAGEMGNSLPIVSTNETWFSSDLQVAVSATRSDPREGKSTYLLNNIQRTEPAATLFQVPADYTMKDAPSFRRGGR